MRKDLLIIYAAFFLSLAFLVILSMNYYKRLATYIAYNEAIEHTHRVIQEINNLGSYLKDAETGQRGFLLTEDSVFLEPYLQFSSSIKPSYEKLVTLTKNNPVQRENLTVLNYAIARRMDYLNDALILFKSERRIFVRRLREGKRSMDDCTVALRSMKAEEERLLSVRRAQKEKYEEVTSLYSSGTFLFALLVFIATFLLIIREFRRRIINQRELERKVEELNQTNSELEQIAFVASHDLQEPLRKIRTFSDLFLVKHKGEVSTDALRVMERIQHASERMQGLVEDLVNFTSLVTTLEKAEPVALRDVIEKVQYSMMDRFAAYDAKLSMDFQLPVITGYRQQLCLLFECLIDNALKFSRPGMPPTIFVLTQDVTPEEMKEKFNLHFNERYIKILVRDNGIGFDNAFALKMFGLFQRLHSQQSDYNGKGIGLTMVKRIMTNHAGYVTALGKVNEGAEFALYFPFK